MTANLDSSKQAQKPVQQRPAPTKNTTQVARVNTVSGTKPSSVPAVKNAGNAKGDSSPISREAASAAKSAAMFGVAALPPTTPAVKNAGGDGPAPARGDAPGTPPVAKPPVSPAKTPPATSGSTPPASPAASTDKPADKPAAPAKTDLPGEFGRKAALAAQKDPKVFEKGLEITDPNKPMKADFFAYSETDVARIDTNKDGKVSADEFNTAFKAAIPDEKARKTFADTFFKALDVNQDSSIDVVENIGQIWTQMGLSTDAPQQMKITNKGIDALNEMVLKNPEMVRQLLAAEIKDNGFEAAYKEYLKKVEEAKKQK
jgi:hypothetical protein